MSIDQSPESSGAVRNVPGERAVLALGDGGVRGALVGGHRPAARGRAAAAHPRRGRGAVVGGARGRRAQWRGGGGSAREAKAAEAMSEAENSARLAGYAT